MIRTLTLVLLLASPALADPLPLLPGSSYDVTDPFWTSVNLRTSAFTAFGNNDGNAGGLFQGVTYCQSDGLDCTTHRPPQPLAVGYGRPFMSPALPCALTPFLSSCPTGTYPVEMDGTVTFLVNNTPVSFDYIGTGQGVFSATKGIFIHADFGTPEHAIQNPEPATWLLLLTGLIALACSRYRASMSSRSRG